MPKREIIVHTNDLPCDFVARGDLAIDTEAMGLHIGRDRLCLVQLYCSHDTTDTVHMVHFKGDMYDAPNLKRILTANTILKVFHFARFDLGILQHTFNISIENIYCTKTASRIARTYVQHHGLRDLCAELLQVKISKQQQTSDWGSGQFTQEQIEYAANDVIFLHRLKEILDTMLEREGRMGIANKCFAFLPTRAYMDVLGWPDSILAHKCEENG